MEDEVGRERLVDEWRLGFLLASSVEVARREILASYALSRSHGSCLIVQADTTYNYNQQGLTSQLHPADNGV
jgi:hypothetical protein